MDDPQEPSTSQNPPDQMSETSNISLVMGDSWNISPIAALPMGFDSNEEWEEEVLRQMPDHSNNSLSSPIIPRKSHFKGLTLAEIDIPARALEESLDDKDLTTPQHVSTQSVDCPGRPMKGYKVASPPASERSSCRHLFFLNSVSESADLLCNQDVSSKSKQEQRPKFTQQLELITSDTSIKNKEEEETPKEGEYGGNEGTKEGHEGTKEGHEGTKEKETLSGEVVIEDTGDEEMEFVEGELESEVKWKGKLVTVEAFKPKGKQRPDSPMFAPQKSKVRGLRIFNTYSPLDSPTSSVSECSDCVDCSSASISPLSSPILSQVKPMSQTIESSPDELRDKTPMKIILDLPSLPVPIPKVETDGEKHKIETEEEIQNLGITHETEDKYAIVITPMSIEDGTSKRKFEFDDKKIERDPCLTPSSVGSVGSNFTAISGVSPLSSDASHMKHHHRRHHHHHHHHHRHHHRHHHHSQRGHLQTPAMGDNVMTSTPIHKKKKTVVDQANVSSITSTPDDASLSLLGVPLQPRPRFSFTDDQDMSVSALQSQGGGCSEWVMQGVAKGTMLSGSDKENVDPIQPGLEDTKPTEPTRPKDPEAVLRSLPIPEKESSAEEHLESTTSKEVVPGEGSTTEVGVAESNKEGIQYTFGEPISGADLLKKIGVNPLKPFFWGHKKTTDIKSRQLTKEEAAALWAAPVNFSDDVWEKIPTFRRSSSVDETLFRPGADKDGAYLSVTLE